MTDSFFVNLFFRNCANKDVPALFPTSRSRCSVIHSFLLGCFCAEKPSRSREADICLLVAGDLCALSEDAFAVVEGSVRTFGGEVYVFKPRLFQRTT